MSVPSCCSSFFHAVAQGRLGQVQHASGGRQRPLFLDLLDDVEVEAFKHSHDSRSWIVEIKPFYFIEPHPYHPLPLLVCMLGSSPGHWLTGSSRDIPGNAQIDPDERKK
jgi:hypothetical protein